MEASKSGMFRNLLEKDPENPMILYSLGNELFKENDYPQARECLERAVVNRAMPGLRLQVTAARLAMLKVAELQGLIVSGGCTLEQKLLQDSRCACLRPADASLGAATACRCSTVIR